MTVGNILSVTLEQTYLGQKCINVWEYEHTVGSDVNVAVLLRGQFDAIVLEALDNCQVAAVSYDRLLVQNRMVLSDNAENIALVPSAGIAAGAGLPPMVAVYCRSARPDLSKRYSYKRFVGAPVTAMDALGTITAPYLVTLEALATAMETVFSTGGQSFAPIQAKRTVTGSSVVYSRNYYITNWVANEILTTQNSRKFGRGD